MIGQQKTLHTRMKAVSVFEHASQPLTTAAAAMTCGIRYINAAGNEASRGCQQREDKMKKVEKERSRA
jgi:hypothetical protein